MNGRRVVGMRETVLEVRSGSGSMEEPRLNWLEKLR